MCAITNLRARVVNQFYQCNKHVAHFGSIICCIILKEVSNIRRINFRNCQEVLLAWPERFLAPEGSLPPVSGSARSTSIRIRGRSASPLREIREVDLKIPKGRDHPVKSLPKHMISHSYRLKVSTEIRPAMFHISSCRQVRT